jgi:hypothetical protein
VPTRIVQVVPIVALVLGCTSRERTPPSASAVAASAPGRAASAAAPNPASTPAVAARQLAEETILRTGSGASLQAPKGGG